MYRTVGSGSHKKQEETGDYHDYLKRVQVWVGIQRHSSGGPVKVAMAILVMLGLVFVMTSQLFHHAPFFGGGGSSSSSSSFDRHPLAQHQQRRQHRERVDRHHRYETALDEEESEEYEEGEDSSSRDYDTDVSEGLVEINPNSRRANFERTHDPTDLARIRASVDRVRKPTPITHRQDGQMYDIHNCPDTPPFGYPVHWNLVNNVLKDWGADNTTMPTQIYQGLCMFDWTTDRHKIERYRELEQPFVVTNHPEVLKAAERWNTPGYLERLIGPKKQRCEHSKNNHHMYFKAPGGKKKRNKPSRDRTPEGWTPPMEETTLTYLEWKALAEEMETKTDAEQVNMDHYYFRVNGEFQGRGGYFFDEFPMFDPGYESLFIVDPEDARGINVRMGMKGIIAEAHYDGGRNWILQMGPGQRRYILAHPRECEGMELHPMGHPSGRHSKINWSDPPNHGPISEAMVNEIVMQAGEALYLPTAWFHFIVSLNINYQCNARAGITHENKEILRSCGFA